MDSSSLFGVLLSEAVQCVLRSNMMVVALFDTNDVEANGSGIIQRISLASD
jgi:hypothetical protein